ncbi:MAG: DNA-binding response regulator [Flavobacterium sp.]|uniref:response regulator transcription factor n=1 Tax=Flavobacterium sp. TaxID=239 RepID=UPI000C3698E2|nr:response regulator transcription factor [Flavobacterium sp.]MBF01878.1 DNA-binding response regulator [Flavobacterium sp.]|tara:strand:- start:1268 stop:1885 length:618 start_codon:yes stop_codon:yes gene_type:complete
MKRIVLIEDYELVRNTYKEMINSTEDFEVVGDFECCEIAIPKLEELQPDILFMDINLPGMNGIEGIRIIKKQFPRVAIIVITVNEESNYVFEALCAGAVGYITKVSGKQKIIEALEQLNQGGAPMSVKIARMVVESFQEKKLNELSDRENEVLTLLAKGKSYASIGDALNVSVNTIKTHVRNIYEKLHVTSKDEVIKVYNSARNK